MRLVALVFRTQAVPRGSIDVEPLVPLAGGGSGGRPAVGEAVDALVSRGWFRARVLGGSSPVADVLRMGWLRNMRRSRGTAGQTRPSTTRAAFGGPRNDALRCSLR